MAETQALHMNAYHAGIVTANEDIFNGNPSTDILSMANYEEVCFIIAKGAGATGTAVITVESCDDTSGTTTTAVAYTYRATTSGNTVGSLTAATASGFTTTAGANQIYEIFIKADELNGSDKYVRMVATESANDPCDGAIISIGLSPKYLADPPREMIT